VVIFAAQRREGLAMLILCSPKCPMIYSRTKRALDLGGLERDRNSTIHAVEGPDEVSSFCRVDLVENEKAKQEKWLTKGSPFNTGWYCKECGDGPMAAWNLVCSDCGSAWT
jgi:hypothetical protein